MDDAIIIRDVCFTELPDEVLQKIFEFCDTVSLCRMAQTCKKINRLVDDHYILWKTKSRYVLGSNLVASPMRNRSKPILNMKKRCEISKKWNNGVCTRQRMLTYPRCMPWLFLEQNAIYCSHGRTLTCFPRDKNGHFLKQKCKKFVPYREDISKFVVNGRELVSCGIDGTVSRWDKSTFKSICTVPRAHEKDICSIDAKAEYIISGSRDCNIKVWKTDLNNVILKKTINMDVRVLSLAILPTNRFFVVGLPGINNKHPLQLFDLESGQVVSTFGSTFRKGAGILDIYPEFENIFLTCGYDTTVQLWDKRDPLNCAAKWTDPFDNAIYTVKSDHNVTIVSGANRHGVIHIWDKRYSACRFMHHVRDFDSPTYCVAFDASHLFMVFDKGAVQYSYL